MKLPVLIFIALALAGCGIVPSHETPRTPWVALVRPLGESMGPAAPRQVMADFGFPYAKLREGDTVIYWAARERLYVHHRLVRRVPLINAWVTQGDANKRPDPELLKRSNYVAKTTSLEVRP